MGTAWVTGARGFIGQHLVRHLIQQGQTVAGLGHGAIPPEITLQQGLTHWINGDIDANNLQQLSHISGYPNVIYHLAGGSSVGLSLQTPAEDFRRSVLGTSSLLEWVRRNTPETHIILTSSAAIYGNTTLDKIPETGCYTPYSPYGFHKRAAELICESYAQAFGLSVGIVRLFSVYGPGLRKQLLWDLCCRLKASPKKIQMHGTGNEVRDWLYIEDAVHLLASLNALLMRNASSASKIEKTPIIINGGTGIGTCVRDIVLLVCKEFNLDIEVNFSGNQREGDPFSLVASLEQLKTLDIELNYPLEHGIRNYVEWFSATQRF